MPISQPPNKELTRIYRRQAGKPKCAAPWCDRSSSFRAARKYGLATSRYCSNTCQEQHRWLTQRKEDAK